MCCLLQKQEYASNANSRQQQPQEPHYRVGYARNYPGVDANQSKFEYPPPHAQDVYAYSPQQQSAYLSQQHLAYPPYQQSAPFQGYTNQRSAYPSGSDNHRSREYRADALARKMENAEESFINAGMGKEGGGAPLRSGHVYGGRIQPHNLFEGERVSPPKHGSEWGLGVRFWGNGGDVPPTQNPSLPAWAKLSPGVSSVSSVSEHTVSLEHFVAPRRKGLFGRFVAMFMLVAFCYVCVHLLGR